MITYLLLLFLQLFEKGQPANPQVMGVVYFEGHPQAKFFLPL